MAKTSTNFKTETQLALTATVLTASTSAAATNIVLSATFFNQSTTDTITVNIYRYTTATGISDDSLIVSKGIPPRASWICLEAQGKVLPFGLSLSATASTADLINAECDGVIST